MLGDCAMVEAYATLYCFHGADALFGWGRV
jgi:hypothetical protein